MERCPRCRQPVVVSATHLPACDACGLGRPDPWTRPTIGWAEGLGVVLVGLAVVWLLLGFRLGPWWMGGPLFAAAGLALLFQRFLVGSTVPGFGPPGAAWVATGLGGVLLAVGLTFFMGPWGFVLVYPLAAAAGVAGLVGLALSTRHLLAGPARHGTTWVASTGAIVVLAAALVAWWMMSILADFEWT